MNDLKNDDQRLVGAKDAMAFLSVSKSTFYRNIKLGIIPKPRYMGRTPVWKLKDIREIYDHLPGGGA